MSSRLLAASLGLSRMYDDDLELDYDPDEVSAVLLRKDGLLRVVG